MTNYTIDSVERGGAKDHRGSTEDGIASDICGYSSGRLDFTGGLCRSAAHAIRPIYSITA